MRSTPPTVRPTRMRSRIGRYCSSMIVALIRASPGRSVLVALRTMRRAICFSMRRPSHQVLVPTGRLELPRVTPLPPQDSVSTNFTTSADSCCYDSTPAPKCRAGDYFGTSLDFDPAGSPAGVAGLAGSLAGDAPGAAGASPAFGAAFSTAPCSIRPFEAPWDVANQVRPRLVAKNSAASTAVERDRKFAEPAAPKIEPDEPLPNAAPMSAPFPCCRSTNPQMPAATIRCTTNNNVSSMFIRYSRCINATAPLSIQARAIARNSVDLSDAPPIRPPSMSAIANSACALSALTLPPYSSGTSGAPDLATLLRNVAWTACACSGVAVNPVPIAHTGA